jgi:O-antigen ligase
VIEVAARERLLETGRPSYRWSLTCAALSCALLPAYTVRWHLGPLPTTLLENAIWLTLVVFAAETIIGRQPIEWRTAFTVPALLFLVAGALDVVFAPDRRAALGLYRAYLIEPMALFIVLATATRTVRQAWLVLVGLAVGGIALAIPNAVVVIDAIRHHTLNLAGTPPVAIYQTQNAVALFLLPLIAVAASLLLYGRNPERLASAAFLVVAVPTFFLTFSRGGYLAIGAVVLGLALTHRRRIVLVVALAVAALLFTRIPAVAVRIAHDLNFSDPTNTLVGRVPLWQSTLQMLRHYPLFGAGLSGFETRIAPYWNATHIDRFIYPHNIVLNFWVATGILGVIAFGWLMVMAFRLSWIQWRAGDRAFAPIQLGVFLALVGIVVHGLVDVPYFKNDLSVEFWVLLALSYAGARWSGLRAPAMVSGLPK